MSWLPRHVLKKQVMKIYNSYLPPSPEDCVYQTDGMCDLIDDENPMLPSSNSDLDQNISQNLSYQDIQVQTSHYMLNKEKQLKGIHEDAKK